MTSRRRSASFSASAFLDPFLFLHAPNFPPFDSNYVKLPCPQLSFFTHTTLTAASLLVRKSRRFFCVASSFCCCLNRENMVTKRILWPSLSEPANVRNRGEKRKRGKEEKRKREEAAWLIIECSHCTSSSDFKCTKYNPSLFREKQSILYFWQLTLLPPPRLSPKNDCLMSFPHWCRLGKKKKRRWDLEEWI